MATAGSFSQPPPTMANQVSQQRPQTPPNPAALSHPGMHGGTAILSHQAPAYINPATVATGAPTTHHIPQHTQLAVAAANAAANPGGPPPHSSQPVQPGATTMPHAAAAMPRQYVKRPRSHALKIFNPDTNEEVMASSPGAGGSATSVNTASTASATSTAPASTAPSEGSPAPSEVCSKSY